RSGSRARLAGHPSAWTHPRKLRAAGRRPVSLHRRPSLGLGRSAGDGTQRLLVLVDGAEEVVAQAARLSVRVGPAGPRAEPPSSAGPHARGRRRPTPPPSLRTFPLGSTRGTCAAYCRPSRGG